MSKLRISDNLTLPLEATTQTFAILAKRGVGKTYTAAVITEELLKADQQIIVADPIGVWWGLRAGADGKSAGLSIVVMGGDHGDVPLEESAGETVATAIVEHGFSAVLDLSHFRKAAQVRFMTAFAEALYRLNRRPLHLMVDEADAFAPQRPMPGEQRLLGSFEDIVRRGRARGLGCTLITQRAAVLNKNVLTQIEVLVVMRTIAPQDREAIEAWIEVHGTPKQRDTLLESLPSLPIGTAWFWSPGWLDIFQRIDVRKRETFDSSATPKVGEKIAAPKQLAPVDLEKLGEQIKASAERAKDNDPNALKRRIAELQTELKKKAAPAPAKIETRQIRIMTKTDLLRFDQASAHIERTAKSMADRLSKLVEMQFSLRTSLTQLLAEKADMQIPTRIMHTAILPPVPAPMHRPRPAVEHLSEGEFDAAKQKILDTIGMLIARGLTPNREMIARWIPPEGIHPNGGRYGSNLAWLRAQGFIEGCDLTEKGWKAARPTPTGPDAVRQVLDGAQRAIFEVLLHSGTFDRESLAQALAIHPNGGRYGSNLARLRTMGLITDRGPIKLTPAALA